MYVKLALVALALFPSPLAAFAEAMEEIHEGKIMTVGSDTITILDNRDGDNDTFQVTAKTKIVRNGKPAKLQDLAPGDKARVVAQQEGTNLIAKEISVMPPA